jgi:hypothetical protein
VLAALAASTLGLVRRPASEPRRRGTPPSLRCRKCRWRRAGKPLVRSRSSAEGAQHRPEPSTKAAPSSWCEPSARSVLATADSAVPPDLRDSTRPREVRPSRGRGTCECQPQAARCGGRSAHRLAAAVPRQRRPPVTELRRHTPIRHGGLGVADLLVDLSQRIVQMRLKSDRRLAHLDRLSPDFHSPPSGGSGCGTNLLMRDPSGIVTGFEPVGLRDARRT